MITMNSINKMIDEYMLYICLSLQGSIQQLVIKDDPRAAEEQCEDDDPYVRSVHTYTK